MVTLKEYTERLVGFMEDEPETADYPVYYDAGHGAHYPVESGPCVGVYDGWNEVFLSSDKPVPGLPLVVRIN